MMLYCVMLTLDRFEVLKRCTDLNIQRAGMPVHLVIVDNGSQDTRVHEYIEKVSFRYFINDHNAGVARMQNLALNSIDFASKLYHDTYVCLLGNDIIMPNNWAVDLIALHQQQEQYGPVGLVGIDCLGHAASCSAHPSNARALCSHNVFGTCLFNFRLIDQVGFLCNAFHPYGLEDSDWHGRIVASGHANYYLANATSEHVCNDVGSESTYRQGKDQSLADNAEQWKEQQAYYEQAKRSNPDKWWFLPADNSGFALPWWPWKMGQAKAVNYPGGV